MAAYDNLALFPDARAALAALSGFKLAILSNGSRAMLEPLVANANLHSTLAAVISVDDLRIYKPVPRVYQLAVDRLGVAKIRNCVRVFHHGTRPAPKISDFACSGSTVRVRAPMRSASCPTTHWRRLPNCPRS